MPATGLEVWDKTLRTTNIWLYEMMDELGPDRHHAWQALGAVLSAVRDHLPVEVAAHLGAQLPLLVRGLYYEHWRPDRRPEPLHDIEDFLERLERPLYGTLIDPRDATRCVLRTVARHVDGAQIGKVIDALPEELRAFWLQALRAREMETSFAAEAG